MKNGEIKTTSYSSNRYGNCEVCNKYCSEIFKLKKKNNLMFGHKECLEKQI